MEQSNSIQEITSVASVVVALIGVLISLFGFLLVYKQVKQVNSSIRSATHNSLTTRSFECSRLIFDNPDLRPYFFSDAPISAEFKDYDRVMILAEIIFDHFEFVFLERQNLDPEIFDKWTEYIAGLLKTSPILREYMDNCSDSYCVDLVALAHDSAKQSEIGGQKD